MGSAIFRWTGLLSVLLCMVLPGRLEARSWSLVSCDPSGEPRWHEFEQSVRAAKPGAPLYVPKPYPTNDSEVVADFLYRFRALHRSSGQSGLRPMSIPNDDRVVDGISNGRVSYRVTRIENWTQMRCGWQHRADFYYLVQVFETAGGAEITRADLDNSGEFVGLINMPVSGPVEPSARRLLPPPAVAMDELNHALGIEGTDAEYVTTFGTIDCDMAFPCLAFHQAGLSFVAYHNEVFEVSPTGPNLVQGKDVGTLEKNQQVIGGLATEERLISLGGPTWTIARKASVIQVRRGVSNFH